MFILRLISILTILFASPAWATTYYIKNGGNNALAGTSDATAWEDWTNVFALLTGDDVYFKCGDTWSYTGNNSLDIEHNGTSGDHVVVGAYYMDGSETVGVNGDGRPEISGPATVTGTYPSTSFSLGSQSDRYLGVIHVSGGTYIDIENIKVTNGAYGVRITSSSYVTVTNVYTDDTESDGIQAYLSSYITLTGNTVENAARAYTKGGGANDKTPACMSFTRTTNSTATGNTIFNSWGEGFGMFYNADDNTIEKNKFYNTMKGGPYLTCGNNNVIRYNLVFGTDDAEYGRYTAGGRAWMDYGIYQSDESSTNITSYGASTGNAWYGNMVANCMGGYKFSTSQTYADYQDHVVVANTFVGNYNQLSVSSLSCSKVTNNTIKNNIFWDSGGTGLDLNFTSDCSGLDFDYNLWSSAPSANVTGSNDPTPDTPDLTKTTGWGSLTQENPATISDFVPAEGGNAIDGATAITSYNYRVRDDSASPGSYTIVSSYSGSGWELGAIELTGAIVTVITNGSPSGTLAYTTTVNLEADTNVNATLKFDTSDVAYGSMGTTFNSTGGTDDHLHTLTGLTSGAYTYYVRAADSTSSYVISFSIDPGTTNLITTNTITGYTADTLAGYEYHNICDSSTEVGPNNTAGVSAQAYYVEADLGAEYDITESSLFGDTLNTLTCNTWQFRWKQAPGDSWTEAWAAEDCNQDDWDLHQSLSITNARYVRMDAVSATAGTEIREWRVFGTLSSQGEATGTGGAGRHFSGAVEGQYFEDAVYGR
jgi:parallel beta-helix repeat protein